MLLTCVIILIVVADDVFDIIIPYALYDCVIWYLFNRFTDNDTFCVNRFYLNFVTEEVDKPEK